MKWAVAGVLFALLDASAVRAQDSFVVPSADAAAEGDSNNTIPFTYTGGNARYQQVFLASDLPAPPFTIYGIAFRPDEQQGPFAVSIPDVSIRIGTTTQGTALSPQFADNPGADQTLVASGPLSLSSAAVGPPGGPDAFDIEIWFDPPFAYAGGNLLLDVAVQPYATSGAPLFDAVNLAGDPVARVFSVGASGGSVDATTGEVDTQGLVTKFLLAPEPSGAALAGLAALASLAWARRRRGA